jgi:hypothetical protein
MNFVVFRWTVGAAFRAKLKSSSCYRIMYSCFWRKGYCRRQMRRACAAFASTSLLPASNALIMNPRNPIYRTIPAVTHSLLPAALACWAVVNRPAVPRHFSILAINDVYRIQGLNDGNHFWAVTSRFLREGGDGYLMLKQIPASRVVVPKTAVERKDMLKDALRNARGQGIVPRCGGRIRNPDNRCG